MTNKKRQPDNTTNNRMRLSPYSTIITLIVVLAMVIEFGSRFIDSNQITCSEYNLYATRREYEDPHRKFRARFEEFARDNNGEQTVVEMIIQPGDYLFPLHYHNNSGELINVLSGKLKMMENGEEFYATIHDTVLIAPEESVHTWGNVGTDEEAHIRVQIRPPLDFEPYFRTVMGIAADPNRSNNILQRAVIEDYYTVRTHYIQSDVARYTTKLLAKIGKVLGYRPCYPEYF